MVRPTTDVPERRFTVGAEFVAPDGRRLVVVSVGPHREGLLVGFAGVEDRDAAEALRGTVLTIAREDRRALGEDEFWPEDLVGCRVVTTEGTELGRVVEVVVGAAQDRLVVRGATGRTGEIPFVGALVPEVDLAAGRIVVELPEGLFG